MRWLPWITIANMRSTSPSRVKIPPLRTDRKTPGCADVVPDLIRHRNELLERPAQARKGFVEIVHGIDPVFVAEAVI